MNKISFKKGYSKEEVLSGGCDDRVLWKNGKPTNIVISRFYGVYAVWKGNKKVIDNIDHLKDAEEEAIKLLGE